MGKKEVGLDELKARLTDPDLRAEQFQELTRRIRILEKMAK